VTVSASWPGIHSAQAGRQAAAGAPGSHLLPQIFEEQQLAHFAPVFSGEHALFVTFSSGCERSAFHQGLLALVVGGHGSGWALHDFDVIAEDVVNWTFQLGLPLRSRSLSWTASTFSRAPVLSPTARPIRRHSPA